jgi:flagellar hook-associated protein FlgK
MVSMMKYQQAYQASLKIIQTADSMLSDLLNIRG